MEISKLDLVNNKIVELIELKRVVARWQLKREKVNVCSANDILISHESNHKVYVRDLHP